MVGLVGNTLQVDWFRISIYKMHQKWIFGFKYKKGVYKRLIGQNLIIKRVVLMAGLVGIIMVYFFNELTIRRGEGTIKEVIKCHFQSCLNAVDMPKTLQTKCKTCFGGPRMILYGFCKKYFLKIRLCLFRCASISCFQAVTK